MHCNHKGDSSDKVEGFRSGGECQRFEKVLEDREALTMKTKDGALDEGCRKLLEVDAARKQNAV